MKTSFDIDALRTIVVGAELKSFARAALQLGRSQSAISMQLKRLEEQAGRALFRRTGRGLVPTEAGDALIAYARRIIALNDEAAAFLGSAATIPAVRIGLPQDFFDDVMPEAIGRFSRERPGVHVEVSAGRNPAFEEEVRTGRLDVAITYFPAGSDAHGTLIATVPMHWFGGRELSRPGDADPIPLVVFDHPCLFRQITIRALESRRQRWRLALTTPSLPGIWAALRSLHGITARTAHQVPADIGRLGPEFDLPELPSIEVRMLTATDLSPAASLLRDILEDVVGSKAGCLQPQA